jgi:hypothetical protein
MADIYSKVDGDPKFFPNILEIDDELEVLLNQIEMILFTRKGDVLGDKFFGANLEDIIYSTSASAGTIETTIYNQIQRYCILSREYNVSVNVRFFEGTERDIGVVDILIDGERKTGLVLA